jgi:hypothetical protein
VERTLADNGAGVTRFDYPAAWFVGDDCVRSERAWTGGDAGSWFGALLWPSV